MNIARLGRALYKMLKWTLLTILLLTILSIAVLYYFLGSDSGYRQLPKIINHFTPFNVSYDSLSGHLLGEQRWQNFHLSGAGLDVRADDMQLNLQAADLLSGKLNIDGLQLQHAVIRLPSDTSHKEEDTTGTIPQKLPRIDLPVDIAIHGLDIHEQANLSADYHDSQLILKGEAQTDKGSLKLDGKAETRGDYPLTLQLSTETSLLNPTQQVQVNWQNSLLNPQIKVALQGSATGDISLDGKISLAEQTLDGTLQWHNLDYAKRYQSAQGKLNVKGKFSTLHTQLKTAFSGTDIPPADLQADLDIAGARLDKININLNTLGGSANFQGDVDLSKSPQWSGILNIQGINGKKFRPDMDLQIDGVMKTHGADGRIMLAIDTLKGSWQKQPLSGKGGLEYGDGKLDAHDLQITLAGNQLIANGSADSNNADLNLQLIAPALQRLLPQIDGDINGNLHVAGNLLQPQIHGKVAWKNFRLGDKNKPIVTSKQGELQADGPLTQLAVRLSSDAQGQDFPALNLKGSGKLDPRNKLEALVLDIQTLKGKIHADGEVIFQPELSWKIKTDVQKLKPNEWKQGLDGEVNMQLTSEGNVVNGKAKLNAEIITLSGNWQRQPLAGKGKVKLDGSKVDVQTVDVRIGDNHLFLNGLIQEGKLALNFDLDGKQLSAFYPSLSGSLNGKGKIDGSIQTPEIQAQLNGNALSFADYKIANVQGKINTALKKNGNFTNRLQMQGVQIANKRWQEIVLSTEGNFERHSFNLRSTGGDANAQISANGGFTTLDNWKGEIATLDFNGFDMQWHLQKRATLQLAKQNIVLRDFCLVDQYSGLCINLQRDKQTQLDYRITELNPKSFGKLIPNNIRLQSALKGEGKINIAANGQMRGNANLYLQPGSLNIQIKGQPPLNLTLKQAQLTSQFSDKEANSALNIDLGDSGTISGQALIKDFSKQNLSGEMKVNIPDIGKFRQFVPKASEMSGRVNGVLQFSGTAQTPIVSGDIQLERGLVKIPEYATELKDIRLKLSAHRSGQIDIDGNIGTPEGNLDADGTLFLSPLRLNLQLAGKNMLIADSKTMMVAISPDFKITIDPDNGIDVKGKIIVPKANISIPDTSGGVDISKDVVINKDGEEKKPTAIEAPIPLRADIDIVLGDKVYFKNKDINIRLKGGVLLMERPGRPMTGKGTIEVASGVYQLYGQELDIKRGRVTFSGGNIANPTVDVLALRDIDDKDIKVGASVTGPVERLQLKLTSTPAMPDSAILSYLLFGRSPDGTMDNEALLQTAASLSLGGIIPSGDIGKKTGLDVFDLGASGLKAGKYLSKELYVGLKSNFFTGITQFIARYQFTNRFNVEATVESKEQAVDFLYEFETD
ncbi:MAG: translocation/assembly module TamB domain-containing protein [Cardiobacteriaceae bacterium]|nr:translocation/assembly module TamB domain-containing protein [Cardiobacteriaceae bacterium]